MPEAVEAVDEFTGEARRPSSGAQRVANFLVLSWAGRRAQTGIARV